MVDRKVQLLDHISFRLRDTDRNVRELRKLSAFFSGEADHMDPERPGYDRRVHNIPAVSGGGDAQKHIPLPAEAVKLLRKDAETVHIVDVGGGQRLMGHQRDRHQGALQVRGKPRAPLRVDLLQPGSKLRRDRPRCFETLHQFSRDMLGIRRGSAVSGDQELSVLLVAFLHDKICVNDLLPDTCELRIPLHQEIHMFPEFF